MPFFGLFGKKPEQPTQPASGGIETGIPAGAPTTAQPPNPNTMGGLMPTPPVIEQPAASGNLEETETWAAAQAGLNAEKAAATPPSNSSIVPPGANEHLDMASGTTPPLSTYGAPSPASIETATPLVSTPIETPADQFSQPISEVTEAKAPDTGPSSEPAMETQAPVVPPVPSAAQTPETTPPSFSKDAISAVQSEAPALSAEPTDGEVSPTNPDAIETPSATVTPEPALDTTPPPPIEPIAPGVTTPEETPAPVSEVTSTVDTPPASTEETSTNTEVTPNNPPAETPETPTETTPAVETAPSPESTPVAEVTTTEPAPADPPQAA